jgi:beta-glucosidase
MMLLTHKVARVTKNWSFLLALGLLSGWPDLSISQPQTIPPYKRPDLAIDKRVEDLLSRMTQEEKFWQLFMIPGDLSDDKARYVHGIFGLNIRESGGPKSAAEQMLDYAKTGAAGRTASTVNRIQKFFVEETRLGIPIIPFDEALHGLVRTGATAFPQSIALAATWDVPLMERVASAIAREARSCGLRDVLSPVLNIARDPRWGRVEETYGEDPFLSAQMGTAFVRSFEDAGVVTTPKHFAANLGDGGRDSYPIHFTERLLQEVYFPAFKACFQKGGSRSVMTAYNSIDGVPCTSNRWLLRDILKEKWGFGGFVISDASAVGGILDLHHTVRNREESAKSAIEGGLDVIFQSDYSHHVPLLKAFKDGLIDRAAIDGAVTRVLRAKFQLGLFENPYANPDDAEKWNGHPDHRRLALDAARKAIVLLKNDAHVLPLRKNLGSVAVVGPDAIEARLGGYSGPGRNKVSILDGIRKMAGGKTAVYFAGGCDRIDTLVVTVPQECFSSSDGTSGLKGEYFNAVDLSGTPALVRRDPRIDFQWTLFSPDPSINEGWYSVRWTGKLKAPIAGLCQLGVEGDDGYRLFIDGRLLIDRWEKQTFRLSTVPLRLEKNREYDFRLEFHEAVGNVRLRLVWDVGVPHQSKRIDEAVQLAQKCDAAVVVAGIEEGEFRDRADIALPGHQEELIRRIARTGRPVVVVLVGGSAITMSRWIDDVQAVLDAWYPGEAGGDAVAEVLFGECNPGGKLPITFPQYVGQLPLYYNHKPTGRGDDYADLSGKPLFAFGHGLSYTSFEYSGLVVSPPVIRPSATARVRFTVRNGGDISGDEVVQLYVRDQVGNRTRPVMELRAFERVSLRPGESKEILFELSPEQLAVLNDVLEPVVEPGDFAIMIGSSSRDIRLRGVLGVVPGREQ